MSDAGLPFEFHLLTEEQRVALLVIGSGDLAVGVRRSWLLAQARYELDETAQRFAELIHEDEGVEPGIADLIAMQTFGHLAVLERNWMGVSATFVADLVEPAWRRAKASSEAWVRESLRCGLGMNQVEIEAIAPEVLGLLRERDALRQPKRRSRKPTQNSPAKRSTRR